MSKGTRRLIPAKRAMGLVFLLVLCGFLLTAFLLTATACEDLTSDVSTSEDTAAATTTTTSIAPADVAGTSTTGGSATDTTSGSAPSTPSSSDSTTSTTFEPFVMVVTTSAVSSLWARFEDFDSRLHYSAGMWDIVDIGGPGDTARGTNSSATVEMEFLGLRIALVSVKGAAMGKAKLTLDGGSPFYVDLYDPVGGSATVWTSGTLGPGSHTLKIEWSGLKHPSSLNTVINIDAVEVQGTLL